MESFFFVRVVYPENSDVPVYMMGPYLSLDDAMIIMASHARRFEAIHRGWNRSPAPALRVVVEEYAVDPEYGWCFIDEKFSEDIYSP